MNEIIDQPKRRFLKTGLAIGTLSLLAPSAFALSGPNATKELAFHNLHTDERLRITFWKKGHFDFAALAKINHILRDFRTGDVYPIATNLLDLLHGLQTRLQTDVPIELISGYRSPKTNAMLAKASGGIAKKSLHTKGLASDIRMHGVSLRKIQMEALLMRRGGVGFYPKSDFVHVDTGRVRKWG